MGEAGLARDLVLRADVVPDVHGHDGCEMVLGDDQAQPVGQPRFRELDLGDEHARMLSQRAAGPVWAGRAAPQTGSAASTSATTSPINEPSATSWRTLRRSAARCAGSTGT